MIRLSGGSISTSAVGFVGTGSADNMIQTIKPKLVNVGWAATKVKAEITFYEFLTFTHHFEITIAGDVWRFYDPNVDTDGNVPLGGDRLQNLINLGNAILSLHSGEGWHYEVGTIVINFNTTPYIRVYDIPDNGLLCYENNFIKVGAFDTDVTTAYTHDGGWTFSSASYGGRSVTVKMIERGRTTGQPLIQVGTNGVLGSDAIYDGFIFQDLNWRLTCAKYYMHLYIAGSYGYGTYFFAGTMYPIKVSYTGGVVFCNGQITGPTGFGGKRDAGLRSFEEGVYFLESNYARYIRSGTNGRTPEFNFPGYAAGVSVVDKFNNPLNGKNILRLDGTAQIYEPLMQMNPVDPNINYGGFFIMFQFWDSFISSKFSSLDTTGTYTNGLNLYNTLCMLSFQGNANDSCGSWHVLTGVN